LSVLTSAKNSVPRRASLQVRTALIGAVVDLRGVHDLERLFVARPDRVDEARDGHLLGAVLADDQHRRVAARGRAHVLPCALDGGRVAHQHLLHRIARDGDRAARNALRDRQLIAEGAVHGIEQVLGERRQVEASRHEIEHAALQRVNRRRQRLVAGEQDDAHARMLLLNAARDGEPVDRPTMLIGDEHAVLAARERLERIFRGATGICLIPRFAQNGDDHVAGDGVVIQHEDAFTHVGRTLRRDGGEHVHLCRPPRITHPTIGCYSHRFAPQTPHRVYQDAAFVQAPPQPRRFLHTAIVVIVQGGGGGIPHAADHPRLGGVRARSGYPSIAAPALTSAATLSFPATRSFRHAKMTAPS